jgi:hypothetical protein
MSISSEWVLFGVQLGGTTLFSQLTQTSMNPQLETIVARGASAVHPGFKGQVAAAPEAKFATQQLATLLGLTGNNSWYGISGTIDLLYRRRVYLGARYAPNTTNHLRLRGQAGILRWDSIRAADKGEAEAQCTLTIISDGTNPILAYAGSVNLGSLVPTCAEHYVMGPCYINDTLLPALQEWEFTSNAQVKVDRDSGLNYPTFASITTHEPVFRGRTLDNSLWATHGFDFKALSSARVFLRALGVAGPVADATTSHIRFANNSGSTPPALKHLDENTDESGDASNGFELHFIDPLADVPLAIGVGVAIA